MPATTRRLLEPVLAELLRYTNFANGRLLTADDLKLDQRANRTKDLLLGRALGAGVVAGLEVSRSGPSTVAVSPGQAVTRTGQAITLGESVQVQITAAPSATALRGAGAFNTCSDKPDVLVAGGTGLHLLVAAPAAGAAGTAPANGPEDGRLGECVNQYVAEGIQFKLAPVPGPGITVPGDRATLRNRAAYHLFGTPRALPHLFDATAGFGEVEPARTRAALADDEVPLALLYFADNAIQFVDMWAARRGVVPTLTGAQSGSSLWERLAGPARPALAEAMLLQFQAQVVDLARQPGALAGPASAWCHYLPPLGYLPPAVAEPQAFFGSLPLQPIQPDPAHLRFLLLRSALAEPIPLHSEDQPAVGIYTSESPGFTLFVRLDRERLTVRETAQIAVTVTADARDRSALHVAVTDAAGVNRAVSQSTAALYRADSLESGVYQVELYAYGRPVGRKFCQITGPGQQVQVAFTLPVALTGGVPEEPETVAEAGWIKSGHYARLVMLKRLARLGALPAGQEWGELAGVPDAVMLAAIRMGSWLLRHHPGAVVDPGRIRLYVDRQRGDGIDSRMYACAVFGEGSESVPLLPLLLTSPSWSTLLPVPITKAKLAGFDRDLYDAVLKPNGVGEVAVIADAWSGLLTELLKVDEETANYIISEARQKGREFGSTLRVINGIGISLERALGQEGLYIRSVADLARSDPFLVQNMLQNFGVQITIAHARYIIDQARRIAPRDQWAIDSPVIGLSEVEQVAITKLGIATIADLQKQLADATAGAALVKKLGWSAEAARSVNDKITRIIK